MPPVVDQAREVGGGQELFSEENADVVKQCGASEASINVVMGVWGPP